MIQNANIQSHLKFKKNYSTSQEIVYHPPNVQEQKAGHFYRSGTDTQN